MGRALCESTHSMQANDALNAKTDSSACLYNKHRADSLSHSVPCAEGLLILGAVAPSATSAEEKAVISARRGLDPAPLPSLPEEGT